MIGLLGQSVLDRMFWPDGAIEERLGGAPRFAAAALVGVSPATVITHGASPALRRPLHELALEVVEGPTERTTVFEVTLFGDGTWSESITAIGDSFTLTDVATWMAGAVARCRTVVCGSLWRNDVPPEVLEALAGAGRRVFFDGQGAARPCRLGPILLEGPLDPHGLRCVDVLKLGEDEAAALIGGIDPVAALATGVPVVVVTLGERGAVVLMDGEATEVSVEPVLGLSDTVGAGDSFLALMAAAVEGGADPIEATATACAGVAAMLGVRLDTERQAEALRVGDTRER